MPRKASCKIIPFKIKDLPSVEDGMNAWYRADEYRLAKNRERNKKLRTRSFIGRRRGDPLTRCKDTHR